MSVTQSFQSQAAGLYYTGYKSWSHGMTNVSIPEVNMLKNSSTLAVTATIPGGRLLQHRIQKLVPRYDKCLNSRGEYVEK